MKDLENRKYKLMQCSRCKILMKKASLKKYCPACWDEVRMERARKYDERKWEKEKHCITCDKLSVRYVKKRCLNCYQKYYYWNNPEARRKQKNRALKWAKLNKT